MGPPREHGGMFLNGLVWSRGSPLQWGRRVNTAECVVGSGRVRGAVELQWGRRVNTAEWNAMVAAVRQQAELQWGRRVNTAECREALRGPARLKPLQWGRRVNTAEWWDTSACPTWASLASMGPPREHGGMLSADRRVLRFASASMGPPREHGGMSRSRTSAVSPLESFNGAAA